MSNEKTQLDEISERKKQILILSTNAYDLKTARLTKERIWLQMIMDFIKELENPELKVYLMSVLQVQFSSLECEILRTFDELLNQVKEYPLIFGKCIDEMKKELTHITESNRKIDYILDSVRYLRNPQKKLKIFMVFRLFEEELLNQLDITSNLDTSIEPIFARLFQSNQIPVSSSS